MYLIWLLARLSQCSCASERAEGRASAPARARTKVRRTCAEVEEVRERADDLRHLLHAAGLRAVRARLERVGHDAAHERQELEQLVRRRAITNAMGSAVDTLPGHKYNTTKFSSSCVAPRPVNQGVRCVGIGRLCPFHIFEANVNSYFF